MYSYPNGGAAVGTASTALRRQQQLYPADDIVSKIAQSRDPSQNIGIKLFSMQVVLKLHVSLLQTYTFDRVHAYQVQCWLLDDPRVQG